MKHDTKWHIGVRQPSSDKFIYDQSGAEVADCDRLTNTPEENLANARLIAAAPSLLAALDYLQSSPNDPRAHRAALDALKLAGRNVSPA